MLELLGCTTTLDMASVPWGLCWDRTHAVKWRCHLCLDTWSPDSGSDGEGRAPLEEAGHWDVRPERTGGQLCFWPELFVSQLLVPCSQIPHGPITSASRHFYHHMSPPSFQPSCIPATLECTLSNNEAKQIFPPFSFLFQASWHSEEERKCGSWEVRKDDNEWMLFHFLVETSSQQIMTR